MPGVLRVSVTIDGVSDLVLIPSGLRWEHHRQKRPSNVTLNEKPWALRWDGPRTEVIRSASFPRCLDRCRVAKVVGRGRVSVAEQSAGRMVIRFDEGAEPGKSTYEVQIRFDE